MFLHSLKGLKVIEFDKGILILDEFNNAALPEARELMRGSPTVVAEFMLRYLYARDGGKSVDAALAEALKDAIVATGAVVVRG